MTRNNPAYRDENDYPVAMGVSSGDGITPLMLMVDPVTDYLLVEGISSSNSATALSYDKRDENNYPTAYGISSQDGVTLVPIRTDSNGYLLVRYN